MINMVNLLTLLPLQIGDYQFWKPKTTTDNKTVIIFFAVIFAGIFVLVFINKARAKTPAGKSGRLAGHSGGSGRSLISIFTTHRIARSIGFDHEQIKMLDFVFKTDSVTDPEKSIQTPALLDRHFRRAYRVIEQTANTDNEAQHQLSVLFSARNLLENSPTGSITSTRQIPDESQILINYGREKYHSSVLFTKGESLSVECPHNALGSTIKIPKGSTVTVIAFTKSNKGYTFESRVNGYSASVGTQTLLLAHSGRLRLLSQRRFRRRQTVIACNMFFVYVEGEGRKQRLIVDKRRLTGNITDISVGGCSVKTTAPVQGGARIKIEFTQNDSTVAALGQVLRTNRVGGNTVIHMKFLKVTRKSMNIINSYVYEYSANE
ncbi:MAG: PilZ domain-containing protein [Treponema sp.]|jgi:hypothetical protein|nr:PilZ domain-containing protein [Treponema sp.]